MSGEKHLLLLAVVVVLSRCQQTPRVVMSPNLKEVYFGDLFYLDCNDSGSGPVKWYFNKKEKMNETLRIAVASSTDSGSYQCDRNSRRSDDLEITVENFAPLASLTVVTGNVVIPHDSTVILKLSIPTESTDDLRGWNCWMYTRSDHAKYIIKFDLDNNKSVEFQTDELYTPETIFWCTDKNEQKRSNQIIVRTTDKDVLLEMYPFPAVIGDSLTLKCLVWGTDRISKAVIFKDDAVITQGTNPTHKITNVTESTRGQYKCKATYTYVGRTAGPPYQKDSDIQDVLVQAPPIRALLSCKGSLECSSDQNSENAKFQWYHKNDHGWVPMATTPEKSGTYACMVLWQNKRSGLSKPCVYSGKSVNTLIIMVLFAALLCIVGFVILIVYRKRRPNPSGGIYEDVGLNVRAKGDDNYEELQKGRGAKREAEYDTLNMGAGGGEGGEGGYEALKKDGKKEEVYHTLGEKGAAGGEGGYEALKKDGKKEEVYHTLGEKGAAGGEGGYEALKKEGMNEGVYHTLGEKGAAGGGGEYEALKKEGMNEGVYHTLGEKGKAGGEGGGQAEGKQDK